MDRYMRAALAPDILPIALSRSYSALARLWLKDYVVLHERELQEDEIAKIKHAMNQKETEDGALADVNPFMRTVRLDLSGIEELVKVDDQSDDPARTKKELVTILTDTIGFAHELGGTYYPRGHGAILLDPRTGSPVCIDDQRELNELTLLLASEGGAPSTWRYVLEAYHNIVRQYLTNEWFYEMLALLSQKRRLEEHLSAGWYRGTISEARRWRENLDGLDHGTSVYALGLKVWRKLEEKFQSRANDVVDLVTNNSFEPSAPPSGFTVEIAKQKKPAIVAMLNPAHVMLGALECDASSVSTQQLEAKLSSLREFGEISAIGRRDDLAKIQLRTAKSHEESKYPFFSALSVGRLWIALNSIVSTVWLNGDKGSTQVLIKKKSKDFLDNDPETLNLALSIMRLRRMMIDRMRVEINVAKCEASKKRLMDYITGDMSLERLAQLDQHGYTTYVYPTDDLTDYEDLPPALEKYYSSHIREINRWLEEPRGHLEKALSIM